MTAPTTPRHSKLDGTVKLYTYRTARVEGLATLPIEPLQDFLQMLAEAAGRDTVGNHEVYELRQPNYAGGETVTYYWVTDLKVYVGTVLIEGRW